MSTPPVPSGILSSATSKRVRNHRACRRLILWRGRIDSDRLFLWSLLRSPRLSCSLLRCALRDCHQSANLRLSVDLDGLLCGQRLACHHAETQRHNLVTRSGVAAFLADIRLAVQLCK